MSGRPLRNYDEQRRDYDRNHDSDYAKDYDRNHNRGYDRDAYNKRPAAEQHEKRDYARYQEEERHRMRENDRGQRDYDQRRDIYERQRDDYEHHKGEYTSPYRPSPFEDIPRRHDRQPNYYHERPYDPQPEAPNRERTYERTKEPLYSGTKEPLYSGTKEPQHSRTKEPLYSGTKEPQHSRTKEPLAPMPLHPALAEVLKAEKREAKADNPYLTKEAKDKPTRRLNRKGALNFRSIRPREQENTASLDDIIKDIAVRAEAAGLALDLLHESVSPAESVCWWDAPFEANGRALFDNIDDYVEVLHFHELEEEAPLTMLPLTKEEQRRDRRDRRLADQRDHQDMIRAGLKAPDPSRVKLSSLPRLLAAKVDDPTALETRIRAGVNARREAHERANRDRALTPAERSAKKRAKLMTDGRHDPDGKVSSMTVYIGSVLDVKEQFKIVTNARQSYLCGVLFTYQSRALLIAEGSSKCLSKLKHLLLERMSISACSVQWEGVVRGHAFCRFDHVQAVSEHQIRSFLMKPESRGMDMKVPPAQWEHCLPEMCNVEHYCDGFFPNKQQ